MKDLSWMDDANCIGCDTNAFFPMPHVGISPTVKRICAACPVASECLDFSLSFTPPLEGVWGGLAIKERELIRKRRRQHAAA